MIVSIQSVSTWSNGVTLELNVYRLAIINDNLKDSCTFYWQIGNQVALQPEGVQQTWVQDGNLTMTGQDYLSWDGSNDYAMTWALGQLNLSRSQVGMVATPLQTAPLLKATVLPQ